MTIKEKNERLKERVKILEKMIVDETLKNDVLAKENNQFKNLNDNGSEVEVQSGIPIPEFNYGCSGYRAMLKKIENVGDSILIDTPIAPKISTVISGYFHKETDYKFVVRKISETHSMVWRTN